MKSAAWSSAFAVDMTDRLKGCPFCGSGIQFVLAEHSGVGGSYSKWYRVTCGSSARVVGCGAITCAFTQRRLAVRAWNRRTDGRQEDDAMSKLACGHPVECYETLPFPIGCPTGLGEGEHEHEGCRWCSDIARAVEASIEQCCKDVCEFCKHDVPVIYKPEPEFGPDWWHDTNDPQGLLPCSADLIRGRVRNNK